MGYVDVLNSFIEVLKNDGWAEGTPFVEYRKGSWIVVFDTSSWMMVGTERNSRVFDVAVPEVDRSAWTMGLIEHLCKTDDELQELRRVGGKAPVAGSETEERGFWEFLRR